MDLIYGINNDMLDMHLSNRAIHNDRYTTKFENIMRKDTCVHLDLQKYAVSEQECHLFAEGTVRMGMYCGIVRFFEDLRAMVSEYDKYRYKPESLTAVQRNEQANELLDLQEIYIHETFRELNTELERGITDQFNSKLGLRDISFTLFVLLVIFIYLFL